MGNTWYPAAQAVAAEWLSTGTTHAGLPVVVIDWRWLAAAIAFVAFWLVFGSLENLVREPFVQARLAKWSGRARWLQPLVLSSHVADPLVRLEDARKLGRSAQDALDAAVFAIGLSAAGAAAVAAVDAKAAAHNGDAAAPDAPVAHPL